MVRYVGGYQSDDETTRRNTSSAYNLDSANGEQQYHSHVHHHVHIRGGGSGGGAPGSSRGGGCGVGRGIGSSSKLQIQRNRSLTGIYSKEDFREQYCINERALQGLEKSRSTGFLFGCLSSYQESPCKKRDNSTSTSGFFTSCYGRQPPLENNYGASSYDDEYARGAPREYDNDGAGYGYGSGQRGYGRYYEFDERGFDTGGGRGGRCSSSGRFVSRESLYEQAKRYTWDEEMHRYVERISSSSVLDHHPSQQLYTEQQYEDQSILPPSSSTAVALLPAAVASTTTATQQPAQQSSRMVVTRYPSAPVSAIESTRKHVSFDNSTLARSITASSFDEHKMKKAMNIVVGEQQQQQQQAQQAQQQQRRICHAMGSSMNVSQERLLLDSGRKTPEQIQQGPATVVGVVGPSQQQQQQQQQQPSLLLQSQASSLGSIMQQQQQQPVYYHQPPTLLQHQLEYLQLQQQQLLQKKPLLGTTSTCSINSSLMKTQSTQTESFIVRASGPPSYLSLSPRTSYKECNRQLVRMVSQGAQTNGYLLDSMLKELSSKLSKSIHEINVQTDPIITPSQPPQPPEEPLIDPPLEPPRAIDLLDLTNEEEFHENVILGLYSHTSGRNQQQQQQHHHHHHHPHHQKSLEHETTMSSSSGSYSVFLDEQQQSLMGTTESCNNFNMLVMKKILNESPSRVSLPSPSHVTILRPPEGFRDSSSSVLMDEFMGGGLLMEQMVRGEGDGGGFGRGGELLLHSSSPPLLLHHQQQQQQRAQQQLQQHHRKKRPSVRAKSEERAVVSDVEGHGGGKKGSGGGSTIGRRDMDSRGLSKTDAATQSSISLHASLHDLTTIDDDDSGIYMEPYTSGIWVYIGENEEIQVWKGNNGATCYGSTTTSTHEPLTRTSSGESTLSEREFYKKFTALTHRMVHRKASGEIYRRLRDNTLEINKRVSLSRSEGGEFGFRIHGSRPVVVSAVEPNTPAEESGLEVGDVIMSINGVSVLDSSHSDVVRIAKHELLEMELARTADIISNVAVRDDVIFRGDLWRFKGHYFVVEEDEVGVGGGAGEGCDSGDSGGEESGGSSRKKGVKRLEMWVKRHFILRTDYCLYYYKIQPPSAPNQPLPPSSSYFPPLGVIPLTHAHAFLTQPTDEIILIHGGAGATVPPPQPQQPQQGAGTLLSAGSGSTTPSVLYPFELHRTSIVRAEPRVSELILGCESRDERNEWVEVLDQTIRQAVQDDKWVGISGRYVMGGPDCIMLPDCIGVLNKLGRRFKTWSKRYCVLKDACLYVYLSGEEQTALGAAHLHGYRVQTVSSLAVGGKKHAFELIPPTPTSGVQMRHYYLATDSEHDRKRWLAALEYSIDRWINIGEKSTVNATLTGVVGGISAGSTTASTSGSTAVPPPTTPTPMQQQQQQQST